MRNSVIADLKELIPDYTIFELYEEFERLCPYCEHKTYLGRKLKIWCPKCNIFYDEIDLMKLQYKVDSLDLLRLVRSNKLNSIPVNKEYLEEIRKNHLKNELEKQKKQRRISNMILHNCIDLTPTTIQYLKDRHIFDAIKLLDKNIIDVKTNRYKGQETIVYKFKRKGTGIQKTFIRKENGKRYIRNLNNATIISYKCNTTNTFTIVEGIEDALSALLLGENFICLNSTANFTTFEEQIINNKEFYKKFKFQICCDNDETGYACIEQLEILFKKTNMNYDISEYFYLMQETKSKDLNDLLKYQNNKLKEKKGNINYV